MRSSISRRKFLKRSFSITFGVALLSSFSYFYARYIEPMQLKKVFYTLSSPKLPEAFVNKKVIQFSDTHLGYHYTLEQLSDLVQHINAENPDIILFTGDLMDAPNQFEDKFKIIPILNQLKSSLGKFAIYGNHDHGGYGSNDYAKIMHDAGFQLLLNEHSPVSINDQTIIIAGLDDALLGRPDPSKTFANVREEEFVLLLAHEPDIADQVDSFPFTFQLSGHSHGGQVQIPFIGPMITPNGATKYIEGYYDISGNKGLYVNRGIGTTRMPFRFLSKPELTIFTLTNKGSDL